MEKLHRWSDSGSFRVAWLERDQWVRFWEVLKRWLRFKLKQPQSLSITVTPPTFVHVGDRLLSMISPKERRIEIIKTSCKEAMDKWPPKKEWVAGEYVITTTYCNTGVHHVCKALEYTGFAGLMANQILLKMKNSADWAPVVPKDKNETEQDAAQRLANDGQLVIGALKGEEHGHVAVVWPTDDTMPLSKKWGIRAAWVGNVGKENGVMGANWAFGTKPQYFVLVV